MPVSQSSHLQSYEYDQSSQTLTIEFQNGSVYQYTGVPLQVYQDFVQSGGAGTYFWAAIRYQYPTAKLTGPQR